MQVDKFVDRAEQFANGPDPAAASADLRALAAQLKKPQYADLRAAILALAETARG